MTKNSGNACPVKKNLYFCSRLQKTTVNTPHNNYMLQAFFNVNFSGEKLHSVVETTPAIFSSENLMVSGILLEREGEQAYHSLEKSAQTRVKDSKNKLNNPREQVCTSTNCFPFPYRALR